MINSPINYKLFKDLTNHRKKTNREVVFRSRPPPFFNTATMDETFQQSGKQDSFRYLLKSLRVMLVCMKVQGHSSLEPPLQYRV